MGLQAKGTVHACGLTRMSFLMGRLSKACLKKATKDHALLPSLLLGHGGLQSLAEPTAFRHLRVLDCITGHMTSITLKKKTFTSPSRSRGRAFWGHDARDSLRLVLGPSMESRTQRGPSGSSGRDAWPRRSRFFSAFKVQIHKWHVARQTTWILAKPGARRRKHRTSAVKREPYSRSSV